MTFQVPIGPTGEGFFFYFTFFLDDTRDRVDPVAEICEHRWELMNRLEDYKQTNKPKFKCPSNVTPTTVFLPNAPLKNLHHSFLRKTIKLDGM